MIVEEWVWVVEYLVICVVSLCSYGFFIFVDEMGVLCGLLMDYVEWLCVLMGFRLEMVLLMVFVDLIKVL